MIKWLWIAKKDRSQVQHLSLSPWNQFLRCGLSSNSSSMWTSQYSYAILLACTLEKQWHLWIFPPGLLRGSFPSLNLSTSPKRHWPSKPTTRSSGFFLHYNPASTLVVPAETKTCVCHLFCKLCLVPVSHFGTNRISRLLKEHWVTCLVYSVTYLVWFWIWCQGMLVSPCEALQDECSPPSTYSVSDVWEDFRHPVFGAATD